MNTNCSVLLSQISSKKNILFFFLCFVQVHLTDGATLDFESRRLSDGSVVTSIYVEPGEHFGLFNTIDLAVVSDSDFLNYDPDGVEGTRPLFLEDNSTFRYALLETPPIVSSYPRWIVLPGSQQYPDKYNSSNAIVIAVTALGTNAVSENRYFVANAMTGPGQFGTASALFINAKGNFVSTFSANFPVPVPEPATAALGALALAGVLGFRRRS